jgi:hypothetical protein
MGFVIDSVAACRPWDRCIPPPDTLAARGVALHYSPDRPGASHAAGITQCLEEHPEWKRVLDWKDARNDFWLQAVDAIFPVTYFDELSGTGVVVLQSSENCLISDWQERDLLSRPRAAAEDEEGDLPGFFGPVVIGEQRQLT